MRSLNTFRPIEVAIAGITTGLSVAGLALGGVGLYHDSKIDDIRQSTMGAIERKFAVTNEQDTVDAANKVAAGSEFAAVLAVLGLAFVGRRQRL